MSTHHGILVHVIFSTKYRTKLIAPKWSDDLYGYIGGTVREHDAVLVAAGGIQDHVHLLLKTSPKHAISATVQLLKANSSRWINDQNYVSTKFAWQRGYGAFSVSESNAETVRSYIAKQAEHHAHRSFEDEYLDFLKRHGVDYDPRYVFDREIAT